MTLRIVTDSTCDLPPSLINKHRITVIPVYINVGEESYKDGIDLSREEFYARLPNYPEQPKTASPSASAFKSVYEQLTEEGATAILSIHVAASLSGILNAARLGAQTAEAASVVTFDSGQFSLGLGYQVLEAVRWAQEGLDLTQILERLKDQRRRTYMYAVVDTFEYLRRSGRVSRIQASIGELLRIKPLLTMYNGEASADRVRTRRRAIEHIVAQTEALAPLEKLGFYYTDDPSLAEQLKQRIQHLHPPDEEIYTMRITSAVGAHVGLGGVGLACVTGRKP
ncbi:MAG: DegV family protein [Anaerolineae bacterium]